MTPEAIQEVGKALLPEFMTYSEAGYMDDPESVGDVLYRALCLIIVPHMREKIGLEACPSREDAAAILRATHPYFEKTIDKNKAAFNFTYDFHLSCWKGA